MGAKLEKLDEYMTRSKMQHRKKYRVCYMRANGKKSKLKDDKLKVALKAAILFMIYISNRSFFSLFNSSLTGSAALCCNLVNTRHYN
jgi:hypothetical protein